MQALGFVDRSLRSIGQVVFQNNPLSGLIILLALFFNSAIYGTICILGVVCRPLQMFGMRSFPFLAGW